MEDPHKSLKFVDFIEPAPFPEAILRGKSGRFLCVAALKEELWESMWPFSGGHILEKGPPGDRPRMCSKPFIL